MDTDPQSGAQLARDFHAEVVGPLLKRKMPGLRYAAGRLGSGSDVLGLDDPMSRDHDWGCRLTLLVDAADADWVPQVDALFTAHLPDRFHDRPVRFPTTWAPENSHQVQVATVGGFAASRLGFDPLEGVSVLDWLLLTGQAVLEVTAGPVFADATVELTPLRRTLEWYPREVELFLLACGWQRLGQRLPLVGRTGHTGQSIQSRVLAAGLVEDLIGLAFQLGRQWKPYDKWREARLAGLSFAERLLPLLSAAMRVDSWQERESALVRAVGVLLDVQRSGGWPTPPAGVVPFHDRPSRTVDGQVPTMLLAGITDATLRQLPIRAGAIEQWVHNVDVLTDPTRRAALRATYHAWLSAPPGTRDHDLPE